MHRVATPLKFDHLQTRFMWVESKSIARLVLSRLLQDERFHTLEMMHLTHADGITAREYEFEKQTLYEAIFSELLAEGLICSACEERTVGANYDDGYRTCAPCMEEGEDDVAEEHA
jgi:hypothetical protein